MRIMKEERKRRGEEEEGKKAVEIAYLCVRWTKTSIIEPEGNSHLKCKGVGSSQ